MGVQFETSDTDMETGWLTEEHVFLQNAFCKQETDGQNQFQAKMAYSA